MPKRNIKVTRGRLIQPISIKDTTEGRRATPFITRVNQENIREAELAGQKTKFVRAAPIASGNSGSLAQNEGALIELVLTANDANVIKAWPEINIYVDVDGGVDNLWFGGDSVTSDDANLQLGFIQHIGTSSLSGLSSNQARAHGIITNRDSSSHTYYIYVRWIYLIIE